MRAREPVCTIDWTIPHALECSDIIPDIMFEDSVSQNQSQRILIKDTQKFALQLAIENANEEDEGYISVMRRAANVLRKCITNFISGRQKESQGSV